MEKPLLAVLCIKFGLLDVVRGFPVEFSSVNTGEPNLIELTSYFITAIGFLLTIIVVVFGCVCCRNGKGFKEFSNSSGSLSNTRTEGFVNPTSNAELTIFPPAGVNSNQICRFEPLPEIKPQIPNLRPAAFSCGERDISSQDWFSEPHSNFPRNQLKYFEEYGRGWFGRVVEGEAQNITPKEKLTKVIVKILHEDATVTDQMYFLHEVKFYKELNHPNILRLLGRCLETEPFLIILECYPNGDLKTFLSQNLASARALVEQGATLQMCSNITSGLQFMHKNKFIHTDLAARNCLVGPDLTVKIGDYGNSIENFKSDYYCAGSVALPIRWCAPETLKCTDVTIETREVTPPANIWSLGIIFWEIFEFCKLPYSELNDDQVIVRVLGDKNYILEKPSMFGLYKDELYHLMKLCWNPPLQRPTASQIQVILDNLISSGKIAGKDIQIDSKRFSQDFERRWQTLKPNHILKRDNNSEGDQTNCNIISSKLKNAKVVDSSLVESPLGLFMSTKNVGQNSPRFCLKSNEEENNAEGEKYNFEACDESNVEEVKFDTSPMRKSKEKTEKAHFMLKVETCPPEILNPNQKFKNFESDIDSWLKGVEINNEEDESYVRKISEAIRDLDAALAMEKTSSSEEESGKSSHQNSPGKDFREIKETGVEFKLESDVPSSFMNFNKSFELNSLQNSEQPQSLNFTDFFNTGNDYKEISSEVNSILGKSKIPERKFGFNDYPLEESSKENDSLVGGQSGTNGSDTDDEIWRKRIERGEISEKVKEKSKSIANLMILTHFDATDESDYALGEPLEKNFNRSSLAAGGRRSGSFARSSTSSINFGGSESDITNAVLKDEFEESLKKLSNDHREHGRFDSLGMILPTFAGRENVWENLLKNSKTEDYPAEKSISNPPNQTGEGIKREGEIPDFFSHSENESEERGKENGGHFLGEIASKKSEENKSNHFNEGNNSSREKSIDSDEFSAGKTNSIRLTSKCDSNKFNSDGNSSKENSSHSKKEVREGIAGIKKIGGESDSFSVEKKVRNDYVENLENVDDEKEKEDFGNSSADFLSEEKKIGNSPKESQNQEPKGEGENDLGNPEKMSLPSIPLISVSEAKDDGEVRQEEEEEEICWMPPGTTKMKPFKFVLKESEFVPEILITAEEESDGEEKWEEEEKIELNLSNKSIRPFKFVLNEDGSNKIEKVEHLVDEKELFKMEFDKSDLDQNPSNSNNNNNNEMVILGACEDYTLDFFKGLKTTSEDINLEKGFKEANQKNHFGEFPEEIGENSDWIGEPEKTSTHQMTPIKRYGFDVSQNEIQHPKNSFESPDCKNSNLTVDAVRNFIESEMVHTERVSDPYQTSEISNLTGLGNDEEYENFKLRTPDDERSSDSGFRDKGSLSESVEDACEGKYNLEDIEAELEDAYGKGAFGNRDGEKENEKESAKVCVDFDLEESKFGEGEIGRNEEEEEDEDDFSDVEGEMEFWQSKESSDYYPEISEFNPNCSSGWYLHPPEDENTTVYSRNVNEEIVNAIRNELRENLPLQTRSFDEFNENFASEDPELDSGNHQSIDFSIPLSPIMEENMDPPRRETGKKKMKNLISPEERNSVKMRKNVTNLMESVKSIDTNTFVQYLDYMVENEGRDLDEDKPKGRKEKAGYESKSDAEKSEENSIPNGTNNVVFLLDRLESGLAGNVNVENNAMEEAIAGNSSKPPEAENNILVAEAEDCSGNNATKEAIAGSGSKPPEAEDNILVAEAEDRFVCDGLESGFIGSVVQSEKLKDQSLNDSGKEEVAGRIWKPEGEAELFPEEMNDPKGNNSETIGEDRLENEESIFSPGTSSPDRERSLSDISRSSNGALSEITMSSPDLVPDYFSISAQETLQNNEIVDDFNGDEIGKAKIDSPEEMATPSIATATDSRTENELFLHNERSQFSSEPSKSSGTKEENDSSNRNEDPTGNREPNSNGKNNSTSLGKSEVNDSYEMSTSFMGDEEGDEGDVDGDAQENSIESGEQKGEMDRSNKDSNVEDPSYAADWDSDSSVAAAADEEEEEASSSSGEFIWKDGDKVSKLKAVQASDCDLENTVFKEFKIDGGMEASTINLQPKENAENEKDSSEKDDENYDDNDSSTGSSASITDFVPSAWNSQAIPSRSAIRNSYEKADQDQQQEKKSVWFKKQKYHCVYEYPREPSDNEDSAEGFGQFNYDKNSSENPNNHFIFGVNTVEPSNKHFPYGISNFFDYSNYKDWDISDRDEGHLNLTDGEGIRGKSPEKISGETDFNFYSLNLFDYDFNNGGIGDSEFFVSSSSRPFQAGSTSQVFPETNQTKLLESLGNFNNSNPEDEEKIKGERSDSRDFSTPDSGLEDSANVSPSDKKAILSPQEILLEMGSLTDSKEGVINVLDSLKFNFSPEIVEANVKKTVNPFSENGPSSSLSPKGLGELRHARDRLKLDLPFNHNAELGAMISKKIDRIH